MKITSPAVINSAGLLATALMRGWMNTLDCRWVLYDRSCDTALDVPDRRRIYLFWHEYVLIPLDRRGHTNVTMLLSRHRDGDVLNRMALHQGFGVVRGSTFSGASTALRELIHVSRNSHLTITPDGPRGPCHHLNPGIIKLAQLTGVPVLPMSFHYERAIEFPTWDRFAIPLPFSRVRIVFDELQQIPRRMTEAEFEQHRARLEQVLRAGAKSFC